MFFEHLSIPQNYHESEIYGLGIQKNKCEQAIILISISSFPKNLERFSEYLAEIKKYRVN